MFEKTSWQQPLVSIYWDYQNVSNIKIAKDSLLLANSLGCINNRKVYSNWCNASKLKKVLESLDFDCIHVGNKFKNAVDFKIAIDCVRDNSDIAILISGDSYCEILIDDLHLKSKKVVILAQEKSVRNSLKFIADKFYYTSELNSLFKNRLD
ncbi:NYN domain-containing protein [Nostoc sp. PCC 7107]|uniref:NYN domain-containing protein n=1 Tax=Nostoc sp. PCC 7107 TaxID=317936 RepID=UPI00029F0B09|nr:NYN domain-containing protein [Nostoc sp. PCC 7107]AFY45396.1 hypothetical protein Nos7107_4878 [Nostoc sp. PCC 7107]